VNPAKILKIDDRKGSLEKGKDADFIVWSPFENFRVKKENILMKDKSLYAFKNHKFYGKVHATFLRGSKIYDAEVHAMEDIVGARGEIIRRSK
jgi:allantoinase